MTLPRSPRLLEEPSRGRKQVSAARNRRGRFPLWPGTELVDRTPRQGPRRDSACFHVETSPGTAQRGRAYVRELSRTRRGSSRRTRVDSGRGPTSDISPRRTFQSCGNSSSLLDARTRPIFVRRPSDSIVSGHPRLPQSGLNLRNLYIRNGRPYWPRRSCENRMGLPPSIQTASMTISMSGARMKDRHASTHNIELPAACRAMRYGGEHLARKTVRRARTASCDRLRPELRAQCGRK